MSEAHEWNLVIPQRGEMKWHLWRSPEQLSICAHVDPMLTDLVEPPPHRHFLICQQCRCYAQRNNLKLPRWAITPRRKRAKT